MTFQGAAYSGPGPGSAEDEEKLGTIDDVEQESRD
jgi:hypothetical protein